MSEIYIVRFFFAWNNDTWVYGTKYEMIFSFFFTLRTTTPFFNEHYIQGFPGVLITVGQFIDFFLSEMNFMQWELDSIAPLFWQIQQEFPIRLSK